MSTGIIQKYLRWERKSKENCQKDFRLTTETETPWTQCDLKHGNWQKLVLRKISIWEGVQPELYIVFPPPHSPSCSGKISTDRSQGKKNCTIFLVKYWQNDCAYGRPYKRSTKGHNSHQSVRHWYSWPCRSYYALLLVTVQNIDVHLYSAVWLHALKPHARCVWQRGEGGECDNKGRKAWGRERGLGDEGTKKSKTNVISAAAERKQCLFTWWSFSCSLFQRVGYNHVGYVSRLAHDASNVAGHLKTPQNSASVVVRHLDGHASLQTFHATAVVAKLRYSVILCHFLHIINKIIIAVFLCVFFLVFFPEIRQQRTSLASLDTLLNQTTENVAEFSRYTV